MNIDLPPFIALSVLLIVIPGPDTAVVTKNALLGGRRAGMFAAVGVALGSYRLDGAPRSASRRCCAPRRSPSSRSRSRVRSTSPGSVCSCCAPAGTELADDGATRRVTPRRAARQGLLSDLGNPKIAVFFTSFLPQFVHSGGDAFASLLLLGAIFAALTLAWLVAYVAVIGNAATLLVAPRYDGRSTA